MINTKEITEQLINTAAYSLEFNLSSNLNTKGRFSLFSLLKTAQEKVKQLKITTKQTLQSEPIEMDDDV